MGQMRFIPSKSRRLNGCGQRVEYSSVMRLRIEDMFHVEHGVNVRIISYV